MGLYKKLSEDIEVVDVIIAGGGVGGCIVAARLAEADPSLSILVIEYGRDNYQDPTVTTPAMFAVHLAPATKTAIFLQSKKSDSLAGRETTVPTGGILGGGSSINFLMYTRAQRADFDSWETPGWAADDLVPFLKKLETYHGPRGYSHGSEGPVQVSDGTFRVKRVEEALLGAAALVGWPQTADLQSLDDNNAFATYKRYASPEGKRSDVAHMYLHPLLRDGKHPNLHILVESQVIRVLFDENKRASGVEFRPNPLFQTGDTSTPAAKRTVHARKLVVVSSGACGTPSILERSGIGRAEVLEKAGVPLVENLPGVGHDYQDHQGIFYPYKTSLEPHETLDELATGQLSFEEAAKRKDPRLGWNALDVAGKCRPSEEDVLAFGPELRAAWDRDFRDTPNKPFMLAALINAAFSPAGLGQIERGQYLTYVNYTPYPYSRGHLHITGPEIDDPLDFDAGYLQDDGDLDLKKQVWAYKRGREIMRRMPMYRGEHPPCHPPFAADSKAVCVKLDADRDISTVKDLEYSPEDDKVIEQFIRETLGTTWHSLGTAKMAPREQLGVVDKDLNVYGVKGLKVADLSIAPKNVAANTYNTALVVAEKAADIIMRELRL
ncbi:GMC oxidoreductase [Xylaria intraflava]|nr:GMC oxidoreductase [Xylaria intraflava]